MERYAENPGRSTHLVTEPLHSHNHDAIPTEAPSLEWELDSWESDAYAWDNPDPIPTPAKVEAPAVELGDVEGPAVELGDVEVMHARTFAELGDRGRQGRATSRGLGLEPRPTEAAPREASTGESGNGWHPEPQSEAEGLGASLAPSHTRSIPIARNAAQAGPRGAPLHKPEGRGRGDGARLRGVSTAGPCNKTGEDGSSPVSGSGSGSVRGAVTPRRFDGAKPSIDGKPPRKSLKTKGSRANEPGGPLGLVPSGDGGPKLLRCALDWLTVVCVLPVSVATWAELGRYADARAVAQVATPTGILPVEVRRLGRDLVARSVAGVRLLLRDPAKVRRRVCSPGAGYLPELTSVVRPVWLPKAEKLRCEARAKGRALCVEVPVKPDACVTLSGRALAPVGELLRVGVGEERREVYGVEVQFQGTLFSSVERGGDVLAAEVWAAVCSWLYGDRGWSDPAAAVARWTRAGRMDVAADVAFTSDPSERWVSWGIYGDGHHDTAFSRFSTRARKTTSEETVKARDDVALGEAAEAGDRWVPVSGRRTLLGKQVAGRTLYLGSSAYALLCVYERSKKRDGDWGVLEPTLRACGWDGESEVVRTEVRVSRRWLCDQILRDSEGAPLFTRRDEWGNVVPRSVGDLTFPELVAVLPSLVGELPGRFRHTDPSTPGPRVRDRESSPWWAAVSTGFAEFSPGGGDLARVVSTRREASAFRTIGALRSGFARLVALRGAASLWEVWDEVFAAWNDRHWRAERDAKIESLRARYAMARELAYARVAGLEAAAS